MKKRVGLLAFLLFCTGLAVGCGQKKETGSTDIDSQVEEIKKQEWQDSSGEVEAFKKLSLTAYPGRTIGEALAGEYDVKEWKYKEEENKKFLKCSYTYQEKERSLVFYQDEYDNVNVAEYFIGDEKQSQEEIKKCCEDLFSQPVSETAEAETSSVFPESRVGYYSNGYWAMDLKSIDNASGTVRYDGYEYGFSATEPACWDQEGKIVDANTLEIYDATIKWDGDSFSISNEEDAMIMSSMAGRSHDTAHGAGTYTKSERPKADDSRQISGVTKAIELYAGEYNDYRSFGDNPACPENPCRIVISGVTDTSFTFKIEQWDPSAGTFNLIFKEHTAVFTGDGSAAVYNGKQYTLNFTFPDITTIEVSGFDATEGISYMCNGIPGHEFS